MEVFAWIILVPPCLWLMYIWMLYPMLYRTKFPVPPPVPLLPKTPDLTMDPNLFTAKRKARKQEHRRWDLEFNKLFPPVETPLAEGCDHKSSELCYNCDNTTIRTWNGETLRKRQRRNQ